MYSLYFINQQLFFFLIDLDGKSGVLTHLTQKRKKTHLCSRLSNSTDSKLVRAIMDTWSILFGKIC